jgi:NAD(P)H-nitrite reductase large subunit
MERALMRHVIIGGSIAGISAARAIRVFDAAADITIISGEAVKPYYRPMLTTVIEKGDADLALSDVPLESFGIRTVYDRARGIDAGSRDVKLESGGRLKYDKLLIATGSSAVIPEIAGLEGADVYALRTLGDARNIQAAAKNSKNVVVLGGGFVGIKAAIALKRLGLTVTMIEKLDRILYEKLDKRGSAIIQDLLKHFDVEIVTNQSDYEIMRAGGAVQSVRLASGRIIDADMIVVAVGTRPNTEAFRDAGVRVNKGIIVCETLQTNIPDVYAAGDVVECRDAVTGALAVSTLWANAEEMGRLAGKNMAGSDMKYTGFLSLMNTVDILDIPVSAMGLIDPLHTGYETFTESAGDTYRKLVFKNDSLVGALFIGRPEKAEVYAHFIKNQIPVGNLKGLAIHGKTGGLDFGNPLGAR